MSDRCLLNSSPHNSNKPPNVNATTDKNTQGYPKGTALVMCPKWSQRCDSVYVRNAVSLGGKYINTHSDNIKYVLFMVEGWCGRMVV